MVVGKKVCGDKLLGEVVEEVVESEVSLCENKQTQRRALATPSTTFYTKASCTTLPRPPDDMNSKYNIVHTSEVFGDLPLVCGESIDTQQPLEAHRRLCFSMFMPWKGQA